MDRDRLGKTTHSNLESQAVSLSKRQCPLCSLDLHPTVTSCPKCEVPVGEQFQPGGRIADKYEILGTIGAGGMGLIYKAKLISLDKVVAIKMLHSHLATGTALMRFQQEGKAASTLSHPNVISIHDIGVTPIGQPYLVMDFVEGETLQEKLQREGSLARDEFLRIFNQVLSAIQHAHSKNLLHRDIKPSNIMLMKDVEQEKNVKILDFGIAKMLDSNDREGFQLTKTGEALGSPLYMSPEQALGKKLDLRSDLYSLGCVMYECLANTPPLMGENVVDTMMKHMNDMPLPLKDTFMAAEFHHEINNVVMKLLSKNPDDRYQTAGDVLAELKKIENHEQTQAETVGSLREKAGVAWKYREIPWDKVAIAVFAVAFLAVGSYWVVSLTRPQKQAKVEYSDIPVFPHRTQEEFSQETIRDYIIRRIEQGESAYVFRSIWGSMNAVDSDLRWFKDGKAGKVVRVIDLAKNKITSAGLRYINHLPLFSLDLSNCGRLDSIEPLKKMKSLNHLSVAETAITDRGLAVLPTLSNLKSINLSRTSITDATLDRLMRMPSLLRVDVQFCNGVSDSKVQALKKALPKVNVQSTCAFGASAGLQRAQKLATDGRWRESLAEFRQELKRVEAISGPNSSNLVLLLLSIASLENALGDIKSAEAHYSRALAISNIPGNCSSKADALHQFGSFYLQRAQWKKAMPMIVQAIDEWKRTDASDWRHLCSEYRTLGTVYTFSGDYKKAEDAFREVQIILHGNGIENDYEEIHALSGLGNLYRTQKLLNEASAAYDKACDMIDNSTNANNNDTAVLYAQAALTAEMQEKYARAEMLWRKAIRMTQKLSQNNPILKEQEDEFTRRLGLVLRIQHKDAEAARVEGRYKTLKQAKT